jgi:hypothetical protein
MQVVCWKKHGKPTWTKFGGKGKPGGGEKGVTFTAHEEHLTKEKAKFKTLKAMGSHGKS